MDRFDAISAFVLVADRQGFAAAARALRLSPSAVTRLVAGLERHLGVRLFNRSTRSVSLTDSGVRFLERARRILADLDEAERMAESERGMPSGRLSVSAPLMFGRLHVGPLISEYLDRHPTVAIDLDLTDRPVNLVEDGIDVAVRIGELADSSLIVRRLGATRRVVVGAPAYLAERPAPADPAGLDRHRIISCWGVTDARQWLFRIAGEDVRVPVEPGYATNSAEAAIWRARGGGGLTQVMLYQVIDFVRADDLRIVLADFERPPTPIQAIHPTSRLLSVKVRALIDLAVATTDWHFV